MPKCGCNGQTCGCALQNGTGSLVTGTGTAADPFQVNVDPSSLNLAPNFRTTNSSTIEFTKTGSFSTADPLLLSGTVILKDSTNKRWTLVISTAGVVSAVAA